MTKMVKQDKNIENFPNLRFPGFQEDWEVKKLGELLEFKNGINSSKEQYGKGVKFINVLDILNNDFITYANIVGKVDVDSHIMEKFSVQYGDVLFQRSSETREEVGTANVYLDEQKNATFGGFVIRGRKIGDYEPTFFNNLLKTDSARESITTRSGGSTRFNVGQEILSSIALYFPALEEQKKISTFLTVINSRIHTQKKIIENLKLQKNIIVKRIFSQGLQLKNINENSFPKWIEKKLGDITKIVNKRNKNNEKLPVYSINNKLGFVPQNEQFEGIDSDERGYDIKLYKIINKNTFAYNPARINVGSIGYSNNLENIIISSLYVCFKSKQEINDAFLFQYLKTDMFNKKVLKNVEGGVRDYLFYENFSRIRVNIPSLEEQNKIAQILSSFDEKINLEIDLLSQYELQKKYLVSNLFV